MGKSLVSHGRTLQIWDYILGRGVHRERCGRHCLPRLTPRVRFVVASVSGAIVLRRSGQVPGTRDRPRVDVILDRYGRLSVSAERRWTRRGLIVERKRFVEIIRSFAFGSPCLTPVSSTESRGGIRRERMSRGRFDEWTQKSSRRGSYEQRYPPRYSPRVQSSTGRHPPSISRPRSERWAPIVGTRT